MDDINSCTNWDDVICPICLDFPHNSVLLQCSSYEKGCRPFVCDTDQLHSNCLNRFKEANVMSLGSQSPGLTESLQSAAHKGLNSNPLCPLCRGEVTGWIVVDRARLHLDVKNRCCEEEKCRFTGTYVELCKHAQLVHPHARPSKIDSARKLDWENFQQSSEIIDVLSTIQSEVPHGVILGDYVIEYDENSGDEFDDFHGGGRNWWTSCIFFQVFKKFRKSRDKRRARVGDSRRGDHRLSYDTSNSHGGSTSPIEYTDFDAVEVHSDFVRELQRGRPDRVSSQRRHLRFQDD